MNATNGKICGGSIAFGGGVPLYKGKTRVGGLGISGDTACADHEIAKRVRHLAQLDPEKGEFADDIVFTSADGPSPFAHPLCANTWRNGKKLGDEANGGRLLSAGEEDLQSGAGRSSPASAASSKSARSRHPSRRAPSSASRCCGRSRRPPCFLRRWRKWPGAVAAVSKRSMAAAVRERFGFHFQVIPLGAEFVIDTLLLTAELGGAAIAVKMLTGIGFQWWVLPAGIRRVARAVVRQLQRHRRRRSDCSGW